MLKTSFSILLKCVFIQYFICAFYSLVSCLFVFCLFEGALNNAAAKKLDLEAWFPGSGASENCVHVRTVLTTKQEDC